MRYACKIECITPSGRFSGADAEGRSWTMQREELIRAIETGSMTCYVTLDGHSHLVTLRTDAAGGKSLVTFLGELEALPLPACA